MGNVMIDMALEIFIPMEGRVTAAMVGYEMDLDPVDVAIYISFFFAFQKSEKEPKGLGAFFNKKKETDIDNKKIVKKLQNHVIETKDSFNKFISNLNDKISKK
jgi:hypothetical protein